MLVTGLRPVPAPEINIKAPIQMAPTITAAPAVKPPPGPPPPVVKPAEAPKPAVRKEYKASYSIQPTYPRQAITQGVTGTVVAWVYVEPNGTVCTRPAASQL